MKKVILLKMGELALKGLNRRVFEEKLTANAREAVAPFGAFSFRAAQSTVYVEPREEGCDVEGAADALTRVFGIASLAVAAECEKDLDTVIETAADFLDGALRAAATFKVEAKRSDKRFPLASPAIMAEAGGALQQKYRHLRVDVKNPDLTVTVEIRDFAAYVHGKRLHGAGGMPVGTGGRAGLLLSGGIDSPVAGYMLAKRGLSLTAIHFESPPYTSERARLKVLELAGLLHDYCGRVDVFVVPFTETQLAIRERCPEDLFTIVMRRLMMRVATEIGRREALGALVTGESLGQVASQTLDAIACTDAAAGLPVLRPLIGMDKEEIVAIARRIGTFETSIQPYEDCCTVFTPKHPRLRPRLDAVERAEAKLGAGELIARAVEGAVKMPPLCPNA